MDSRTSFLGEFYEHDSAGHERLAAAHADHAERGEHLWIVAATYQLTGAALEQRATGTRVTLDHENLLDVSAPGCYICELPLELALGRRCPGPPLSYSPSGDPVHAPLPRR